jgi:hypothetical protein
VIPRTGVFAGFIHFIASIAGFAISGKFSAAEILAIAVGFFEANCSTSSVSLSLQDNQNVPLNHLSFLVIP